jgi:lysophospholipase L1-like esterase
MASQLPAIGAGGLGFTPGQLSGLVVWTQPGVGMYQDAGKTTPCAAAGDPIGAWADQSGSGNDLTQSNASLKLQYQPASLAGCAVARVPDRKADYNLGIPNLGLNAQSFSAFLVRRGGVELLAQSMLLSFLPGYGMTLQCYQGRLNLFSAAPGNFETTFRFPIRPRVVGIVSNGSAAGSATLYLGRSSSNVGGTAVVGANTLTTGQLANNANGEGYIDLCDVAELVVYNRPLSATEVNNLLSYFEGKYGLAVPRSKLVVCDGDSLTCGGPQVQTPCPITQNYPAQLLAALGPAWECYNWGESGETIATMLANGGTNVDPLYDAVSYAKNICVLWGGTNDLDASVSPTTVYNNIKSYCQNRQAAGWKVVVCTILPRSSSSGTFESDRQTVNANVRSGYATFADALADVGNDTTIGQAGQNTNQTYYIGDNIHLRPVGYAIVAAAVQAAVTTL